VLRQVRLFSSWLLFGLRNRGQGHCLRASWNFVRLLRRCSRSVLVVSRLDKAVYGHPWVLQRVRRAVASGVKLRFYIAPTSDIIPELTQPGVTVTKLAGYPRMHFTVGDSRHVRFEGLHPAGEPTPVNSIRIDARRSANLLEDLADKMERATAESMYLESTDARAGT
jgi:hypothetical protein